MTKFRVKFISVVMIGIAIATGNILLLGLIYVTAVAAPMEQTPSSVTITIREGNKNGIVQPGDKITYMIKIAANSDFSPSTQLTLTNKYNASDFSTIDDNFRINKLIATNITITSVTTDTDKGEFAWKIDGLSAGESVEISYGAIISDFREMENFWSKSIVNEVTLVDKDGATVSSNNVSLTLPPAAPHLKLTRTFRPSNGVDEFRPGDTVVYTFSLENLGGPAKGVVLEDEFNERLFQGEISNISGDPIGFRDGSKIRWELGDLSTTTEPITVSYTATLNTNLPLEEMTEPGIVEVTNKAEMIVGGNPIAFEGDDAVTFKVRVPVLKLQLHEPKLIGTNEDPIQPGDSIRVDLSIRNEGSVTTTNTNIIVESYYTDDAVADISEIKGGGTREQGLIKWELPQIAPNETKEASYILHLKQDSHGLVELKTVLLMNGEEIDTLSTSVVVEAAKTVPDPVPEDKILFTKDGFGSIALLILSLMLGVLFLVGFQSRYLVREGKWEDFYFRDIVEMIAIIVIVFAVLILSMTSSLAQNAIISLLSGIAGYVLGRSSGGRTHHQD